MDKKSKPQRHKTLTEDELADITPRGASFDTEEGRAAQGMRPDIGSAQAAEEDGEADDEEKLSPEEKNKGKG